MTYGNLGNVCADKAEYDKAVGYHEKALAIRLRTLGADQGGGLQVFANLEGDALPESPLFFPAGRSTKQGVCVMILPSGGGWPHRPHDGVPTLSHIMANNAQQHGARLITDGTGVG